MVKEKELETKRLDNQLQETEMEARTCERAAGRTVESTEEERNQCYPGQTDELQYFETSRTLRLFFIMSNL